MMQWGSLGETKQL